MVPRAVSSQDGDLLVGSEPASSENIQHPLSPKVLLLSEGQQEQRKEPWECELGNTRVGEGKGHAWKTIPPNSQGRARAPPALSGVTGKCCHPFNPLGSHGAGRDPRKINVPLEKAPRAASQYPGKALQPMTATPATCWDPHENGSLQNPASLLPTLTKLTPNLFVYPHP